MSMIGNLVLSADTHETKAPTFSLLINAIRKDHKYRPANVEAYCPYGKLTLTGDSDFYYFATGMVPYFVEKVNSSAGDAKRLFDWVVPESKRDEVDALNKASSCPGLDMTLFHLLYSSRTVTYFDNRKDPNTGKAPFTLRPLIKVGGWTVFRDTASMYAATQTDDLAMFIREAQGYITKATQLGGMFAERLIGKRGLQCNGEVAWGPEPKTDIRVEQTAISLSVPAWTLKKGQNVIYYTYINLLACAMRNLYIVLNKHTKTADDLGVQDNDDFWMSMASYYAGSYGGVGKDIGMDRVYEAPDVEKDVLAYLGAPFSQAYPYMNMRFKHGDKIDNDHAIAEVMKAVFYMNMCLCFAADRVGMQVIPVQYIRGAMGPRHSVKQSLERYLRPPRDGGGSPDPFWMPMPCLNDTYITVKGPDGLVAKQLPVYVPWPVSTGTNEYVPSTARPESFGQMLIDRGEVSAETIAALEGKVAFVTVTRDVRIFTISEYDDNFVLVRFPIPSVDTENKLKPIHWLLAYVTDGLVRPGPCVMANDAICMVKPSFVHRGWSPVFEIKQTGVTDSKTTVESELSKAMPGGVTNENRVIEQVSEKQLFKSKTTNERYGMDKNLDVGQTASAHVATEGVPGPVESDNDVAKK